MTTTTHYFADFELTTLVRPMLDRKRKKVFDPFWLGGSEGSGLGLFVSALDAEIFRQMLIGCGENWLRMPLADFDLLGHIQDMDGRLECNVVFGFSASLSGELAVRKRRASAVLGAISFRGSRRTAATSDLSVREQAVRLHVWAMGGAGRERSCGAD
jgi:hypothetical protein